MKKKIFTLLLSLIIFMSFQTAVFAAGPGPQPPRTQVPLPTNGPVVPLVPAKVFCESGGINTAIGCLSVLGGQEEFLGAILRWAVGVGGGIAFRLIVYSGFMIMSAAGDPERLKAGQELLTSAISGLILLIFSIFILRVIGLDILGLGAFGFGK